jgi:anti-sigma-K factor RskA
MMTHEDIQADLGLYVLGSLDAEERQAIDRHLAEGCDSCSRELAKWREVVDMVPLEMSAAAPPDLKARLLARVHDDAPGAVAAATAAPKLARRRIGWAVPFAAAAAAILAIAAYREIGWRAELARQATVVAGLRQDMEAAHGDLAKVSAALAARESDVASLRAALASAQESMSILQARDLSLVALRQTKDAPPAEGHVLLSPPTGRALFYAFDLPPVPADKTYELWWITEKEGPVQAGLFHPDAQGVGRVDASVPSNAGAIQAAAVTVEAAGGVPKPQGPMVLLGNVTKS